MVLLPEQKPGYVTRICCRSKWYKLDNPTHQAQSDRSPEEKIMNLKKEFLKRNGVSGLPPISSVENNGLFSSNLKASKSSYILSHRGIMTNLNKQIFPMSSLKKPWPVKNNGRIPAVFQLQSLKSSQKSDKNVLCKAYLPRNSTNDNKSARFVSSKLRNAEISSADINESIKFTIKSKMKNSGGNNLWQKSLSLTRNKMATSRNVTSTEITEDKRRPQDTCYQPLQRMATLDKQFSIRNTIKQFKRWHFEQNAEKMNTPIKTQNSQTEVVGKNILIKESLLDNDFVRMFEMKIAQGRNVEFDTFGKDNNDINNNCAINANGEHTRDKKLTCERTPETRQIHQASSTVWSNKEGSEMFNQMKQYQEENNTVNFDREQWIQVWVADAQTTMEQTGRELCQTFE